MQIIIRLTGTSPLLMHNPQLADPENEWSKRISALTSKANKSDEDRAAVAKLEWMGGLYVDSGQLYLPASHLIGSVVNAAKNFKKGKTIIRSLYPVDVNLPLGYDDPFEGQPLNLEELWKVPGFRNQQMVGVKGRGKVSRTRPKFQPWAVNGEFTLATDVINYKDFVELLALAGRTEGVGDGRALGFGRYTATIRELEQRKVA